MIELNDINFKYDNANTKTLSNISLNLKNKEVLAVVGPSGGGKSTLLRIIAGLERPQKGVIKLDNRVIVDPHTFINPEKRGVGMVFQDYALFPHMTVRKNIEFGISKLSNKEKNERVEEVLDLVNLKEYQERYPHELSGGQQQRIALVRAIAPNPKILLLDEPFSNLDTHLLEKIRNELFRIIREIGTTTIMVTHNLEDAKTQADRIISIKQGNAEEITNV